MMDVTSGPGKGHFDLPTIRLPGSIYQATVGKEGEVKGEWRDSARNLLVVLIRDVNKCETDVDTFVRIEPQGPKGPAFGDTGSRRVQLCDVKLQAFSDRGMDGTFTCTRLGGGTLKEIQAADAGVFIDASGTFSLRA